MEANTGMNKIKLLTNEEIKYLIDTSEVIHTYNDIKIIKRSKKYALVKNNKFLTSFKYDRIYSFYEGRAPVELNNKEGFIDLEGNEITPIKYDDAWHFHEGRARVQFKNKCGYINLEGEEYWDE